MHVCRARNVSFENNVSLNDDHFVDHIFGNSLDYTFWVFRGWKKERFFDIFAAKCRKTNNGDCSVWQIFLFVTF
jgi:hypothetical protein